MQKSSFLVLILFVLVSINSCSETKTPVASVSHETGWLEPTSNLFHAQKVAVSGAESCRSCHGENVDLGESGSFCIECHADYPIVTFPHTADWTAFNNPNSHGNHVRTNETGLTCNNCHSGEHSIGRPCTACH